MKLLVTLIHFLRSKCHVWTRLEAKENGSICHSKKIKMHQISNVPHIWDLGLWSCYYLFSLLKHLFVCLLFIFYLFFTQMQVAEIQHGTEYLSRTSLLQSLDSLIRYSQKEFTVLSLLFCSELTNECPYFFFLFNFQQHITGRNDTIKSNDDKWKAFGQR